MKKRLLEVFGLSLVMTAVLLTGCAGKGKSTAEPSSAETVSPEDLSINQVIDLTGYVTLGKYKGIAVEKVVPEPVTEDDITQKIQETLAARAERMEKDDMTIEDGDYVTLSFQGYLGQEMVNDAKCENLTIQIGAGTLVEDLETGLLGHTAGEEIIIDAKIPKDDASGYAGETLEYHVTVSDIYQLDIPALSRKTAREYFSCNSVREVRQAVRKNIQKERKQAARESMAESAWKQAVSNASISSYPEKQLQEFEEQMKAGYEAGAQEENLSVTEYMENHYGLSQEEYEEQLTETAREMLASEMVYQAIIKAEDLTLTDTEYEEGLEEFIDGENYASREELLEQVSEDRLRQRILYKKAYDLVYDHAIFR